jgi:transcriptional regulator with XRE-family HTH domain
VSLICTNGGTAVQTRDSASDAAIRERLNQLSAAHSQADIARKAGVTRSNVSRYLRDTRIPAEFCARMVAELGANPSWLLVGEGTQNVTDVGQGTIKLAGGLLELVQALNEVARRRLGSLSGKHHLRVLRELDDSLRRYETLRATLNESSRPIFSQLIIELTAAVARRDLPRAQDLSRAVGQVARLCDDDALASQFDQQQAHLELLIGNREQALDLQRRVFMRELRRGVLSEGGCRLAFNLVVSLCENLRYAEGARIGRAALALADPKARKSDDFHALRVAWARALIETGRLKPALAAIQRSFGRLRGRAREAASGTALLAALLSCAVDPIEAHRVYADTAGVAAVDLRYAIWLEQPPYIEAAIARAIKHSQLQAGPTLQLAQAVLAALKGGRKQLAADTLEKMTAQGPGHAFAAAVWRTKLARLQARPEAKSAAKQAEQLRQGLPPDLSTDWLTQCEHWRNASALTPDKANERFSRSAHRKGYRGAP